MKVSNTEEKNLEKASTISFKELKKVSYLRNKHFSYCLQPPSWLIWSPHERRQYVLHENPMEEQLQYREWLELLEEYKTHCLLSNVCMRYGSTR